jgi:hypothetical protein
LIEGPIHGEMHDWNGWMPTASPDTFVLQGRFAADEGAEALVLLAAGGAAVEVGAQARECGVHVGARELELDVAVELLEAGIAPDFGLGRAEQAAQCVFEIGALGHFVSSRKDPTDSPHSSR